MSTRVAYPGTESNGDTLTTTNFDKVPGGWIGDVQVTSDQGSITSEVDVSSGTLTVTAGSSRRLKISGHARCQSTSANDRVVLRIYKGATQLNAGSMLLSVSGTPESVEVWVTDTPSSGSNTYKLTLERSGAGTITNKASSTLPTSLLVEDIGPA